MPKGENPNSRENLKRGRKFKSNDDKATKEAAKRSGEVRREMKTFSEAMRERVDDDTRASLVNSLVMNMAVSPEWYKLGLRMLGELPPEQVEVSKPAVEMAEEIKEALEARAHERQAT